MINALPRDQVHQITKRVYWFITCNATGEVAVCWRYWMGTEDDNIRKDKGNYFEDELAALKYGLFKAEMKAIDFQREIIKRTRVRKIAN